MMIEHGAPTMLPPALNNSSCWPDGSTKMLWTTPGPGELLRATLILLLSLGILFANLLVICVINSRRYSKYIHPQPKYLLTSLASNDLAIGLLVTPFGFLPAVYGCWPYGEVVCQIQDDSWGNHEAKNITLVSHQVYELKALLRGALTQQSAVILVCMAIDRYVCMLHPRRYHRHSSKKYYMRQGCMAVMSTTWIASVAIFGSLVLPSGGYYFNGSGLLACDPFFAKASFRILACCCFYFPTTMVLMYCYGSAFHVNKLRLKRVVCVNTPEVVSARGSRETTVDLGVANNGSDEPGFHRDGHAVDHPGSCGSLHRKQATSVPRLPRYVARALKQLLESLSLLAAQQSLPPYIPRDFLHEDSLQTKAAEFEASLLRDEHRRAGRLQHRWTRFIRYGTLLDGSMFNGTMFHALAGEHAAATAVGEHRSRDLQRRAVHVRQGRRHADRGSRIPGRAQLVSRGGELRSCTGNARLPRASGSKQRRSSDRYPISSAFSIIPTIVRRAVDRWTINGRPAFLLHPRRENRAATSRAQIAASRTSTPVHLVQESARSSSGRRLGLKSH